MKTIKIIFFTILSTTLIYGQKVNELGDQNKKFHTIKLEKDKNGYKSGAAEWITGGKDSVQNFMVKPLKLQEPVYVTLSTKFPQYELKLRCYTGDRENPYIIKSTKGEKFASHIFRVQSDATFGVESDVKGVPYLLYITTGKPFPISDKPFLRIVSTEDEYNAAKKNLNIVGVSNQTSLSTSQGSSNSSTSSKEENNGLLYSIIGFLVAGILFLVFFLIKKSKNQSKSLPLLLLIFTLSISNVWSQDGGGVFILDEPPLENPFILSGDDANAAVQNYNDQTFTNIPIVESQGPVYYNGIPIVESHGPTWEVAEGMEDISGTPEALEMQKRMKESRENFEEEFRDKMPGEINDKGRNQLPIDATQKQINEMSERIQRLQREVAFLRESDRQHRPAENPGVIIYCTDNKDCAECYKEWLIKVDNLISVFAELQSIHGSIMTQLNGVLDHVKAIANSTPGASMGYELNISGINRTMNNHRENYNKKFDEFLDNFKQIIDQAHKCNETYNVSNSGYLDPAFQLENLYRHWVTQRIHL